MLALSIQKLIFLCVCSMNTFIVQVTTQNCQSGVLPFPPHWGTWLFFFFAGEGEGGRENHLNTMHLLTEDIKQEWKFF